MQAQELFERALEATAAQLQLSRSELTQAIHSGECFECDRLRQQLAHTLARYLVQVAPELRAVYGFDPTFAFGEEDRERVLPSESAAIHLLVWTETKTAALAQQVAALEGAFGEARREWLCPKAGEWCNVLSITVVDDAEVKARRGYAALIDSLWVRPTLLWQRT